MVTRSIWVIYGHHTGGLGTFLVPPDCCRSCCAAEVFNPVPGNEGATGQPVARGVRRLRPPAPLHKKPARRTGCRLNLFSHRSDQWVSRGSKLAWRSGESHVWSGQYPHPCGPCRPEAVDSSSGYLADVAADWRIPYRPEKHYMRGPGPKWREKHARGRNSAER